MRDTRFVSALKEVPQSASRRAGRERATLSASCTHILIPLELHRRELPTVRFGVKLAAEHCARVTFLHVVPTRDEPNPMHWLDAIERLHQAWTEPADSAATTTVVQQQAHEFLRRAMLPEGAGKVPMGLECRAGNFAHEVARAADDLGVDLVLLSGGRFWGWLHILPGRVRSILRLTQKRVAVMCSPLAGSFAALQPIGWPESTS